MRPPPQLVGPQAAAGRGAPEVPAVGGQGPGPGPRMRLHPVPAPGRRRPPGRPPGGPVDPAGHGRRPDEAGPARVVRAGGGGVSDDPQEWWKPLVSPVVLAVAIGVLMYVAPEY